MIREIDNRYPEYAVPYEPVKGGKKRKGLYGRSKMSKGAILAAVVFLATLIPFMDPRGPEDEYIYAGTVPEPTPAPRPSVSPSPTPVITPTATPTSTPTPSPTATPVITPSPTPVITPTPEPVITPTPTPDLPEEPTPEPTVTPTPTPTTTPTPSPEPEPTPVTHVPPVIDIYWPVNKSHYEGAPTISFSVSLNDLAGGSASARLQKQGADGSFQDISVDYAEVPEYSGGDEWSDLLYYTFDEEDYSPFGNRGVVAAVFRVVIDLEYPDGISDQVISDPFHICDGEFVRAGTASYNAADQTVTAVIPVWSGVEEAKTTFSGLKITHWSGPLEIPAPEFVSVEWADGDEETKYATIVMRCREPLPPGEEFWTTIDFDYDTDDNGNIWQDDAVADFDTY